MTPRRLAAMLAAPLLVVLCALASLPAPALGAGAAQATNHAPRTTAPSAAITVTSMSPTLVGPTDTVRLTGYVSNAGTVPITGAEIDLQLPRDATAVRDRAVLEAWAADQSIDTWGWNASATSLGGAIAPGTTRPFQIEVPAARLSLPLAPSAWGSYLARLDLATNNGLIAVQRTFILWQPQGAEPASVSVATLVPLLAEPASPDPTAKDAATDGATPGPSEPSLARARDLLAAAAPSQVGWLLDPALLQEAPGSTKKPDESGIVDELKSAASAHELYRLPFADIDLQAVADGDARQLYRYSLSWGSQSFSVAGLRDSGLILWPAHGQITPQVANFINASGPTPSSVLLSSSFVSPGTRDPVATSARALVDADAGTIPGVIVDDSLSSLLGSIGSDPLARQHFAAALATASTASQGKSTSILLTPSREWRGGGSALMQGLTQLGQLPWVRQEPVSRILRSDVSGNQVQPRASDDTEGIMPVRSVDELDNALSRAADYAVATDAPDRTLLPLGQALLFPMSTSLRAATEQRATSVQAALTATDSATDTITLRRGSAINLIAASGILPVSVTNDGDRPVTVTLQLESADYRLQSSDKQTITIPPDGEASVKLAVKAVASGNVTLQVRALNKYGHDVAEPSEVSVRVRADWEDLGTAAVGLLFAGLLVVGLFRSRRRKRKARGQAAG